MTTGAASLRVSGHKLQLIRQAKAQAESILSVAISLLTLDWLYSRVKETLPASEQVAASILVSNTFISLATFSDRVP